MSLEFTAENGIISPTNMAENGGDLDQALTFAQKGEAENASQLALADTTRDRLPEERMSGKAERKRFFASAREKRCGSWVRKTSARKNWRQAWQASKPSAADFTKIKESLAKAGT